MSWVEAEFSNADLNDRRLDKRLQTIVKNFDSSPQSSIQGSSKTWSECMAAYRFFENEKVSPQNVMYSHLQATIDRISSHQVVLVAHDTTSLNYSGHTETFGLGKIGDSKSGDIGLQMHTSYALSDKGLCLGILNQEIWARKVSSYKNSVDRIKAPIEKKESNKWLRGIQASNSALSEVKANIIHLCDREGDIYEVFHQATMDFAHFIIRCRASKRRINQKSHASEDWEILEERLAKSKILGGHKIEIPLRKGPNRIADCNIKVLEYTVSLPRNRSTKDHKISEPIVMTAISVKEKNYRGKDKIDWILLSSSPIKTIQEAIVALNRYCKRWQIEVFHRNLKSGCKVQSCGLNSIGKLKIYISIMSVIAWRMQWISWLNRVDPKQPGTKVFSDIEIKILSVKTNYKSKSEMSIDEAIVCLAMLGGYLNRKNDPKPGSLVLFRGWIRLMQSVEDYNLLKLMYKC